MQSQTTLSKWKYDCDVLINILMWRYKFLKEGQVRKTFYDIQSFENVNPA